MGARTAMVLVLGLVLVGCGTQTQAAAVLPAAALPKVTVRLADLPTGVTAQRQGWYSNVAAAGNGKTTTLYRAHGRLGGYQSVFVRSGMMNPMKIVATVNAYRTVKGQTWSYATNVAAVRQTTSGGPSQSMAAPKIGDASAAYSVVTAANGFRFRATAVVFRRGTAGGTITVSGMEGMVDPALAVHLAQKVDRRIVSRMG